MKYPGFMRIFPALVAMACCAANATYGAGASEVTGRSAIDRQALVGRHSPRVNKVDPWASLTVGNGKFAFTADVTGLQTFTSHYRQHGIATETQARWLWHTNANPNGYKLSDTFRMFTNYGRTQGYPMRQNSPAGEWLRQNPHPLPLPQLSLDVAGRAGGLRPEDVSDIDQTLDLWRGVVTSRYRVDGQPVSVTVAAHPERDLLAIRMESPLIRDGRLAVRIAIPRGHDLRVKNNPPLDWSLPESHRTQIVDRADRRLLLEHVRDESRYQFRIASANTLELHEEKAHTYRLAAAAGPRLEFTIEFAEQLPASELPAEAVYQASAQHWGAFWRSGGAIDFSGSTDPRAAELERRVVLSQYLTAVQFVADFPPQESGLTINTWYGKHHTEMIWWHAAHFALWGRDALLARNLDWFVRALPTGRELAKERGLRGARWAKMIGPDGRESPGGNPLIIWNQPHPIHLAELLYRNNPTAETLERYAELVQDTADCMASMLNWDEEKRRYNLGPPMWIAQEIYDQATSMNPTYELSYWIHGLNLAQKWRERRGLERVKDWDERVQHIAKLPQKDGKYVAIESTPDTWDNRDSRHDHPSFLMALGQLPGDGVDRPTMARTLDAVLQHWDWEAKIWGWDYPMIAMTAARLGEPKKAVDVLLKTDSPNNWYMPNGHCKQREDLPVYLPGNGALLSAVAMMAAGWDDAPSHDAPGFPKDGTWVVRSEGLKPLP